MTNIRYTVPAEMDGATAGDFADAAVPTGQTPEARASYARWLDAENHRANAYARMTARQLRRARDHGLRGAEAELGRRSRAVSQAIRDEGYGNPASPAAVSRAIALHRQLDAQARGEA